MQIETILTQLGVDPPTVSRHLTPLHVAAILDEIQTACDLLDHGGETDVDEQDGMGRTALWYAAGCRDKKVLSLLLHERDIDVNLPDNLLHGSPLHRAFKEALMVPEHLKERLEPDSECWTASANFQMAKDMTPLHVASLLDLTATLETLLQRPDVDVDVRDSLGRTPFEGYAAKSWKSGCHDLLREYARSQGAL